MNIRFYIMSVFVTLLMTTSALSDQWVPFKEKSYLSPNGTYKVVITKDRMAIFTTSDDKQLARWQVVDIPTSGFVANNARYFVTLGRYGGSGWDSVGLCIYDDSGELLKKWSIRELVGEDDVWRSVSSLHWFDSKRSVFSDDYTSFNIQLLMEDVLQVNLSTFELVRNAVVEENLDAAARFRRGKFYMTHRVGIKKGAREYELGLALLYSAQAARELGRKYIQFEMYDDAERILREVIRRYGNVADDAPHQERGAAAWSYYSLYEIYEQMGRSEDSLEAIKKGHAAMWRPHDGFEKALGKAYLRNGKDEKAKEAFQRYIKAYGRDGISRTRLAAILLKHGRIDWALAEANLAVDIKDRGNYPERAFRTLGDVHRALGNWSTAEDAYIKARDLRIAKGRSTYELDKLITDMKARIRVQPINRK